MKYKQIFKSWWFWGFFLFYTAVSISANTRIFGFLGLAQIIGVIVVSFLVTLFISSIFWALKGTSEKIKEKIRKRDFKSPFEEN